MPVAVAKLDRLRRDVHFISGLVIQGAVPGRGAEAGRRPLRPPPVAALAEKERALLLFDNAHRRGPVRRLRLPERGVTLGNPKLSVARKGALEAVTAEADRFAANVLPIIQRHEGRGCRPEGNPHHFECSRCRHGAWRAVAYQIPWRTFWNGLEAGRSSTRDDSQHHPQRPRSVLSGN